MSGIEDPVDDLSVTPPKTWATGVPAVTHALEYALGQTSVRRTALTLLNINQAKGFDCPAAPGRSPPPASGTGTSTARTAASTSPTRRPRAG